MSKKAILFFLLMIFISSPLFGGIYFLSWGQVRNNGFLFAGRIEDVRNQCISWMNQNGIIRIQSFIIRSEKVNLSSNTTQNEACRQILDKSLDLGNSLHQFSIKIEYNNHHMSFVGNAFQIAGACAQDLSYYKVDVVSRIIINGKSFRYRPSLRGAEICGEITSKAKSFDNPYGQKYIAGSIMQRDFVFYGHRQVMLKQCKQFIRGNNIRQTREFFVGDERKRFSQYLKEDDICEEIYKAGIDVLNINARYTISGSILSRRFFFLGTAAKIIYSCSDWVRKNNIFSTYKLIVNGENVKLKDNTIGVSICNVILDHKIKIETSSLIHSFVSGSINSKGFSYSGSLESIRDNCNKNLMEASVGLVSNLRIFYKPVILARPLRGMDLCAKISDHSVIIPSPQDQWIYKISGRISEERFWLLGSLENIIKQCSMFFSARPFLRSINEFYVDTKQEGESRLENNPLFKGVYGETSSDGKDRLIPLSPVAKGPEACSSIASQANVLQQEERFFVAGQVEGFGYSMAANKSTVLIDCIKMLDAQGIEGSSELHIFDEKYEFLSNPLTSSTDICTVIIQKGLSLKSFPEYKEFKGQIEGKDFSFTGNLKEINDKCTAFLKENTIEVASSFILGGKKIEAALGEWHKDEICGLMIYHKIND